MPPLCLKKSDVIAAQDAVVLEEPPLPGFAAMLAGEESIDDYLERNAFEFPDHARRTCELARELARDGGDIVVESNPGNTVFSVCILMEKGGGK